MIADLAMLLLVCGVLARWGVLVVAAGLQVSGTRRRPLPQTLDAWPGVSVLVPAFDEEAVIGRTVDAIRAASYPGERQILVIDDGSSDDTAGAAAAAGATVLTMPENGGKAAALRAGVEQSEHAFIVTVDADTQLAPSCLQRLVAPLVDAGCDAVASNVKVGNRHRMLTIWQSIEYVTGINLDRRAQAQLGAITTIPGAAAGLRRSAVLEVGNFSSDTVTEDTDLAIALLRAGRTVVFQPSAHAYTEAPETWGALFRQRTRWLYGYLQCLYKHRDAFFRPTPSGYALGWFGLPNLLFVHVLVYLLFPISALYLFRIPAVMSWTTFGMLVAGFLVVDLLVSTVAYLVDGEAVSEMRHGPAQRFFWPFFLWTVFATVLKRVVSRAGVSWDKITRTGSVALPADTPAPDPDRVAS